MKIEFDTRYIELLNNDVKAATMFAIGVAKQKEADDTDEPEEYGNYWGMTREEWNKLGFGKKFSQKKLIEKIEMRGFGGHRCGVTQE